MLDLSRISVVDNHCHSVLREQRMDTFEFRRYFAEATDERFAQMHTSHAVYYLWMLRQLATFYGCERTEEAVLAARNSMSAEQLLQRLLRAAQIDTLILDVAHPALEQCYAPEQIAQLGGCRSAKMLRLETLMQRLVVSSSDFDELVARFRLEVSDIHSRGYCALKSIVAYRSGLDIIEWSKDAAVAAFVEARLAAGRQEPYRIMQKPLIDYLLHVAFVEAARQEVAVQFHTGYGDSDTDMRLGNPLHLRAICERRDYHSMPIVILHESYPYCQLGAYLAAVYPHVYFDLSYTIPFVDKLEMLNFTRQALSIAPASKIMYSSDGIYVPEMHWAGAVRGRQIIGQVLQEMLDADELDQEQAYQLAQLVLHDNAYTVYKL